MGAYTMRVVLVPMIGLPDLASRARLIEQIEFHQSVLVEHQSSPVAFIASEWGPGNKPILVMHHFPFWLLKLAKGQRAPREWVLPEILPPPALGPLEGDAPGEGSQP